MTTSEIKVEVIHKETIKPSSPTPRHFKTLKLSVFDQIASDLYVPLLFFYRRHNSSVPSAEISNILKTSLSKTLTLFYPWAGQFQYNDSIGCNDRGAEFLEAQVNCPISKILDNPDAHQMLFKQLLPAEHMGLARAAGSGNLILVQASFFECGGVAIGASISHKVADAITGSTFINTWAAFAFGSSVVSSTTTGDHQEVVKFPAPKIFGVPASLFPPLDFLNTHHPVVEYAKEKCMTRRFLFGASEIAALKSKSASSTVPNPSCVEVVSVLVWKCAMEASRSNSGFMKPSVWCQAVNMREILAKPLADKNLLGSLVGLSMTKTQLDIDNQDLLALVALLRKGIKVFKENFGNGISGEEAFEIFKEYGNLLRRDDIETYSCSSLCRLPFYSADFGWGKPLCVFISSAHIKNAIKFMDTRDGDGMEVILTFKEEDIAKIENNKELLAYSQPVQQKMRMKAKL
ncbi:acyltransferase Pun1-like [Malus sylvestris]|uniref:diaboline synthase-like n=1 Tax=Malus domestica TaxID=3750 RepID=UPI0021AD18DC|nr:acyltransferase Pun1-like [Malus sylvestris]